MSYMLELFGSLDLVKALEYYSFLYCFESIEVALETAYEAFVLYSQLN